MALGVLFCVGLFVYRDEMLGPPLAAWTELWSKSTLELLRALGMEATRDGSVISHTGRFAFEIYYRCTAILPISCLVVAILASRGRLWQKLVGVVLGSGFLLAANQLRLVHLFWIGVHEPRWFELMHNLLWPGLSMLGVVVTWCLWRQWVTHHKEGGASCARQENVQT